VSSGDENPMSTSLSHARATLTASALMAPIVPPTVGKAAPAPGRRLVPQKSDKVGAAEHQKKQALKVVEDMRYMSGQTIGVLVNKYPGDSGSSAVYIDGTEGGYSESFDI